MTRKDAEQLLYNLSILFIEIQHLVENISTIKKLQQDIQRDEQQWKKALRKKLLGAAIELYKYNYRQAYKTLQDILKNKCFKQLENAKNFYENYPETEIKILELQSKIYDLLWVSTYRPKANF